MPPLANNQIQPSFVERHLKLIVAGLGSLLVLVVGIGLYNNWRFHIVSIDPPLNNFTASAPTITLAFNKSLAKNGVDVSLTPDMPITSSVQDKTLTINLIAPLQQGQQYTLTIHKIASTSGDTITNYSERFTPTYVPFDQLSPELQNSLSQNQDVAPASKDTITYANDQTLIDQGATTEQVDVMKQAIFLYGTSIKKVFSEVVIDANSVQPEPVDPNNASPTFGLDFTLTIDKTSYTARLLYKTSTVARLVLTNSATHAQVYNSGNIDDTKLYN